METLRSEKIEVVVCLEYHKEHQYVIYVYEIPEPGSKLRILATEGLQVEDYLIVRDVIHVCDPKTKAHLISIICTRE